MTSTRQRTLYGEPITSTEPIISTLSFPGGTLACQPSHKPRPVSRTCGTSRSAREGRAHHPRQAQQADEGDESVPCRPAVHWISITQREGPPIVDLSPIPSPETQRVKNVAVPITRMRGDFVALVIVGI